MIKEGKTDRTRWRDEIRSFATVKEKSGHEQHASCDEQITDGLLALQNGNLGLVKEGRENRKLNGDLCPAVNSWRRRRIIFLDSICDCDSKRDTHIFYKSRWRETSVVGRR